MTKKECLKPQIKLKIVCWSPWPMSFLNYPSISPLHLIIPLLPSQLNFKFELVETKLKSPASLQLLHSSVRNENSDRNLELYSSRNKENPGNSNISRWKQFYNVLNKTKWRQGKTILHKDL